MKDFYISSLLKREFVNRLTLDQQAYCKNCLRKQGSDLVLCRIIAVGSSQRSADELQDHFKTGDWREDDGRYVSNRLTVIYIRSCGDYSPREVFEKFKGMYENRE